MDKVYPIQATLLERMLRHRLIVPPSYCRDVVIARKVIQTVQAGLRESYECLASVPIFVDRIVLYNFGVSACTARQMVFSSPWLTAKKESGSPLQTALVCNSNPLLVTRLPKPGCSSSIPADDVPAGSSSSVPADYVSAGHVLVSADRDRIC
ncbi:hypothetical protein Tco_1207566 [Tanacetum coccineum]